jgi:hypothetical protein
MAPIRTSTAPIERLAYTVEDALATRAFRSKQKLYGAIARGELDTWKDGRTRMISAASLRRYVERRAAEAK